MHSSPTISVIIPTHNRRRLLEETINSVLAQTWTNWELIIIDDASDDDTWSWLSGLQNTQIKTFHLEHHGERSTARNLGLAAAKGEFIFFLDDDDLLPAPALQIHLEAFKRYPEAIGSVGSYLLFDENIQQRKRYVRRQKLHDIWPDLLFGHIPVFGQCVFRTQIIKSAGGWDGEFIPIEDHQLWLRVARLGQVVLQPDIVLHYRVHGGQWRPRKLWKLMTKVRQRAIKKFEGEALARAERILHAREHLHTGENFYADDETFKALLSYLKVVHLAPGVVRSPVTRKMIVPPLLKCCLGGRRVFSKLEQIAKRSAPEFPRSKVVDDYGENHKPIDGKNYETRGAKIECTDH